MPHTYVPAEVVEMTERTGCVLSVVVRWHGGRLVAGQGPGSRSRC